MCPQKNAIWPNDYKKLKSKYPEKFCLTYSLIICMFEQMNKYIKTQYQNFG